MDNDDVKDWIRLLLAPGIGEWRARVLVQRLGSPRAALMASRKEVERISEMGPKTSEGLDTLADEKAFKT